MNLCQHTVLVYPLPLGIVYTQYLAKGWSEHSPPLCDIVSMFILLHPSDTRGMWVGWAGTEILSSCVCTSTIYIVPKTTHLAYACIGNKFCWAYFLCILQRNGVKSWNSHVTWNLMWYTWACEDDMAIEVDNALTSLLNTYPCILACLSLQPLWQQVWHVIYMVYRVLQSWIVWVNAWWVCVHRMNIERC